MISVIGLMVIEFSTSALSLTGYAFMMQKYILKCIKSQNTAIIFKFQTRLTEIQTRLKVQPWLER
jgi:hypothetical protein